MPREIDAQVTVYAAKVGMKIIFEAESTYSNGGALRFQGEKGDKFVMQFTLEDGGLGLTFCPKPTDAFWVSSTSCPTSPSGDKNFKPKAVSQDGKSLIVVNDNVDISLYYYTLRFQDSSGAIVEFDPIIDNRNSGPSKSITSFVVVTAFSAVALIIGFVAGRFL